MKAVGLIGLGLTLLGAIVLAYRDLTAKRTTWDTLASDWKGRKAAAWIGFPPIAVGTLLQGIALAAE